MSTQKTFNPANFGFEWTSDNWYSWDHKSAHKAALKARNVLANNLKAGGKNVSKFSLGGQLITRGGIGSGHPQIEMFVTVYGVNAY